MPRPSWPDEQVCWLRNNVEGRDWETITKKFNSYFGTSKPLSTIRSYANRSMKLVTGKDTRFYKGMIQWNDGMSKEEWMKHFSEESFTKYKNRKKIGRSCSPIGSEHKGYCGNIFVKTEKGFERKIDVILKDKGVKVNPDEVIIFLDGDKGNFDDNNIRIVKRRTMARAYKTFNKIDGCPDRTNVIMSLMELDDAIK